MERSQSGPSPAEGIAAGLDREGYGPQADGRSGDFASHHPGYDQR
jgi:hypothetical protein